MNPFERHGIDHLSPSSINAFAAEPALWVMERLLKKRSQIGAAAHRGSASEAGVAHGLLNPNATIEDCQAIALREFDQRAAMSGDPKRDKEREVVAPIVAAAIPELRQYGIPDQVQRKVVAQIEGIPVPVLGFSDFEWTEHGIVLDLKTTLRLPSEISAAHGRQVSLYVRDGNREGRLCYVTPAKLAVYRLEDPQAHFAALSNIAHRMMRLLAVSNDAQEIAGLVCPNLDSFMWSNPQTRALCKETYGL